MAAVSVKRSIEVVILLVLVACEQALCLGKKIERKAKRNDGREPVDKHLRLLFRPLVIILSILKKVVISGKRINTVPVLGVSRNMTLLVDSGQDSVNCCTSASI